jgi:hypothetical protein
MMMKRSQQDSRLWARRLATRQEGDLDGVPLRELLQRLMATEEALATLGCDIPEFGDFADSAPGAGAPGGWVAPDEVPGPALEDTRELILRQQGALVRELRRRRVASRRLAADPHRTPSAAWPPPPW